MGIGFGVSMIVGLITFVLTMALFALPFYVAYKYFLTSHEQHVQNYRQFERIAKSLEILAEK